MGAPGALGITSVVASEVCFYGGLSVFILTIVAVFVHSLRERGRKHDKMWPIALMALGTLLLMIGAAAYFWPHNNKEPQYHAEISAVAAFNVAGQPGLLNVIPVVNVQNSGGYDIVIIDFFLRIIFADGNSREVHAQPVFDSKVFRGPDGQTEINPSNTLWGRDGAPRIERFRSGRLWFPFTGIYDLSEFNSLNTRLVLTVKDSSGVASSSSIRLGDIAGPRISSLPFTDPPAEPPPIPTPQGMPAGK